MQRRQVAPAIMATAMLALLAYPQDAAGAPIAPQSASKEFHVVAKKDDVHEVVLDGRTCQMTFRAANSAHGELWKMELKKEWIDKQHVYTCLIEDQDKAPPHASFYGWSAHMFGPGNEVLKSYEVWDHQGVLLEDDGYIVEGRTIRSDTHWNLNGLGKLFLSA